VELSTSYLHCGQRACSFVLIFCLHIRCVDFKAFFALFHHLLSNPSQLPPYYTNAKVDLFDSIILVNRPSYSLADDCCSSDKGISFNAPTSPSRCLDCRQFHVRNHGRVSSPTLPITVSMILSRTKPPPRLVMETPQTPGINLLGFRKNYLRLRPKCEDKTLAMSLPHQGPLDGAHPPRRRRHPGHASALS